MDNDWADPAGEPVQQLPIKYWILDQKTGKRVVRYTSQARDALTHTYYHAMANDDQWFAELIRKLVQGVCAYFYQPDDALYRPLEGVEDIVISDEAVRERIDRINRGENVREAARTGMKFYPLDELPWDQQRALVERIEALKRDAQFEIIGPETQLEHNQRWADRFHAQPEPGPGYEHLAG